MLSTILLLVLALAPFAAGFLFRRAALRPGATADEVWFPFGQRLYGLALVNVTVWPTTYTWLCPPMWSRLLPGLEPATLALLMAGGVLLQLIAVQMFVAACVQDVNRRVRGADAGAPNAALKGLWIMARIGAGSCALVVGVTEFYRGELLTAVIALLTGIVGMVVIGRLARPPKRWLPYAVTSGELRDHVFALAARARVKLSQLYVLPMAHSRVANAFAVQNQTVMITDYLLPHLSRDQLDAVMAHELAHLQRKHPTWLAVTLVGGLAGMWTAWQVAGVPTMASYPVMLFGLLALLRRFEYAADAGAVELGARPEALISGLAVLGRLNHVPIRWSRAREWTLTHPSTERRAQALAARFGIDPARVPELLATAAEPPRDPYGLPRGAHEDRVFSSSFKAAALMRNAWTLVLCNVGSAVMLALLGTALGIHGPARAFAFLPLAAMVFGVTFAVLQHVAMLPYRSLRKPLCARLERMGFDPRGRDTEMVGLAPGDRARYYEGVGSWDVGFLWFRPDRLIYLGEETSFSLSRDEIVSLEPGPSFPGWVRPRGLCVRWSRRDQSGAFTLQAVGARSLLDVTRETGRLTQRLAQWRIPQTAAPGQLATPTREPSGEPSTPPVPIPIAPPPTGEVTGVEPHALLKPGAVVITLLVHLMLVAFVATVARLPLAPYRGLGTLDAMLASAIAYALVVAPLVLTRRHRRPDERAERRAA